MLAMGREGKRKRTCIIHRIMSTLLSILGVSFPDPHRDENPIKQDQVPAYKISSPDRRRSTQPPPQFQLPPRLTITLNHQAPSRAPIPPPHPHPQPQPQPKHHTHQKQTTTPSLLSLPSLPQAGSSYPRL